jgi:hypothetical protein
VCIVTMRVPHTGASVCIVLLLRRDNLSAEELRPLGRTDRGVMETTNSRLRVDGVSLLQSKLKGSYPVSITIQLSDSCRQLNSHLVMLVSGAPQM